MSFLIQTAFILFIIAQINCIGNGVNFQPSYYNNGDVTFGWDLLKQYSEIKTIRIEVEPDKVSQACNWISESKAHGYEVIATYHKYTVLGSDDPNELKAAATWWVQNFAKLKACGDFTINLMNEWGSHNQNPTSYASAYNQALSILRKVYSEFVIIDIPGWGQETLTAAHSSSLITDKKIIFSAHIYPGGWNQAAGHNIIPSDLNDLHSTGRPCIIGEFGTEGSGSVDVISVVRYARSLGFWSVLAWAWNGDGGNMNMVNPKWSDSPKAGNYVTTNYFQQVFQGFQ